NGQTEFGEQCDQGSDNGDSSCCSGDCTLRSSGELCRQARSTSCDAAETCDGIHATCPAGSFADSQTGCGLQHPSTIKDHCEAGQCVRGIPVCSAMAGQRCVATRDLFPCRTLRARPTRSIDARANIDRQNFPGPAKLAAEAFEAVPTTGSS